MKSKTKAKPKNNVLRIPVLKKHYDAARRAEKSGKYDCLTQCMLSQAINGAGYKATDCGFVFVSVNNLTFSTDPETFKRIKKFTGGKAFGKPFTAVLTATDPL